MSLIHPNRETGKGRDGFFLVGVLVFCFLLIPVVALLAQSSRAVALGTNSANHQLKLEFLAEGLSDLVASKLSSDPGFLARFEDGSAVGCSFDDMIFTFAMQDHDGKIDLNNAGSELLKAGFRAAGIADDKAELLQRFVEAFRSNTASTDVLRDHPNLPSLKHAPFERIEELNDIVVGLDLPPIDFEPYFTVYKRGGNLEQATAVKSLQAVLEASMDIEEQVAADNKSFDYVDVVVTASSRRPEQGYRLRKTYARLAAAGEVRGLAKSVLSLSGNPDENAGEASQTCEALLGIAKSEVSNAGLPGADAWVLSSPQRGEGGPPFDKLRGRMRGASRVWRPPHRLAMLGTSPRGEKRERAVNARFQQWMLAGDSVEIRGASPDA
jgi:hypothetical protein